MDLVILDDDLAEPVLKAGLVLCSRKIIICYLFDGDQE